MTCPSNVSSDDLRRFSQVATISDEKGFLIVLEQLIAEGTITAVSSHVPADIAARAKAMEAPVSYRPTQAELQRGRMLQLAELRRKSNMPIARYAALTRKSHQQLYKEISARELLVCRSGRASGVCPTGSLRRPPWR